MINRIKSFLFAFVVLSFFVACNEGGSDVKDAARDALENPAASSDASANNFQPTTPADEAQVPTGPTTSIEYEKTEFDFGTIDDGEVVNHVFKFKNTGKEPLIISNAKGSCGCTVPQWPREPIAPGASGEIKVEFNSKGKTGLQTKKVTITANTNPTQTFLTISGTVNKVGGEEPAKTN